MLGELAAAVHEVGAERLVVEPPPHRPHRGAPAGGILDVHVRAALHAVLDGREVPVVRRLEQHEVVIDFRRDGRGRGRRRGFPLLRERAAGRERERAERDRRENEGSLEGFHGFFGKKRSAGTVHLILRFTASTKGLRLPSGVCA